MQTNRRQDARTLISIAFYAISCPQFAHRSLHFWHSTIVIFSFLLPLSRFTSQESGLFSFRVATLAQQSLTRFEGVKKPPSVSLLRPFELPLVEHKGRKRVCAFLPSVATFEVSNVSEGDCFAALQIVFVTPLWWRRFYRNRPTNAATVAGVAHL